MSGIVTAALLEGPATKEALNKKAKQLGHEAPARAIHATLINYKRRGLAIEDDGQFKLTVTKAKRPSVIRPRASF